MNQQELAHKANAAIEQWSLEKDRLVVAIDGYTGVGKTTLLKNLAELNPDIVTIKRDDFLKSKQQIRDLLDKAEDKSVVWELYSTENEEIEKLVTEFRSGRNDMYVTRIYGDDEEKIHKKLFDLSKKIMVVEGVFMFHPKLLSHLWDKRIYLEGDVEKIDARRVEREKARWGKDYFPETHPDSYFRQVMVALKRYQEQYKPENLADLVLYVD